MKLNTDSTADTTYEDLQEIEWNVRILFDFDEGEPETRDHPGCPEHVEIIGTLREEFGRTPDGIVRGWALWEATDDQLDDWSTEIMEAIVAQAKDAYDEDRSEDAQLEKYDA